MASKILFLDIDGVLNCSEDFKKQKRRTFKVIDQTKLDRLNDLIAKTGASIVLSSTWRLHDDARAYLKKRGVRWIDQTPRSFRSRGHEIREWLDKHPEVTTYAILDDDSDFFEVQFPFFVQTSWNAKDGGLQDRHVEAIIKILGEG